MRILKLIFAFILTGILLVFAFQNLESVTVQFYTWGITLPLALMVISVYILGMLTGSMFRSLLKKMSGTNKNHS